MRKNLYRYNSFKLCQRIRNSFDFKTFSEQNSTLNPRIINRVSFIEKRNRQIASEISNRTSGQSRTRGILSRPFIVPKSNSQLNKHAYNQKFRTESLGNICSLLKRGDVMIKIDLQDTYMSVPLAPKSRCLLVFIFDLPLQSDAFRPELCTKNIYQTVQTNSQTSEISRNAFNNIFG